MEKFNSVDEALNFAISEEEKAAKLYAELAAKMEKPWMKKVFEDFAKEELGHKKRLLAIKEGGQMEPAEKKVMDLRIADYLADAELKPDMDYQEALVFAMKAEKAAFKLYSDLAASTDDEELRRTFLVLAQEEARHKLRFEVEYDDVILGEN